MTLHHHEDLRDLAIAAGQVANYCDHADHNEPVDAAWVIGAGETFRTVATRMARRENLNIFELYGERLAEIEERNVAFDRDAFNGREAAAGCSTWRELQMVQLDHDRYYHPDVLGLHKSEQLLHYALHLSKLVAAVAEEHSQGVAHEDFVRRRLPDILLFGIKLATVMSQKLADEAIVIGSELEPPAFAFAGP